MIKIKIKGSLKFNKKGGLKMKRRVFIVFIILLVFFINVKAQQNVFSLDTLLSNGQIVVKKTPVIIQKKIKIPKDFNKKYALRAYMNPGDTILVNSIAPSFPYVTKKGKFLLPQTKRIDVYEGYVYREGWFYKVKKIIESPRQYSWSVLLFLFFDLVLVSLAGRPREEGDTFLGINKAIWMLFAVGLLNLYVGITSLVFFRNGELTTAFFSSFNIMIFMIAAVIFFVSMFTAAFFWFISLDCFIICEVVFTTFFTSFPFLFFPNLFFYSSQNNPGQNNFPLIDLLFLLSFIVFIFLLAILRLKINKVKVFEKPVKVVYLDTY